MTAPKRRAAKRPPARTVSVELGAGPFEGWAVTARADFPAGWLAELQSGEIGKIITVLDRLIVDHNLPNVDDEIASTMADVDPYDGLLEISTGIFDAIGKLPNR